MQAYLSKRYGRCAWVVPVRGSLPWEGCSAGVVVVKGEEEREVKEEVTWTSDYLNAFWNFLEALKDAGTLGSIAISFHPAPISMHTLQNESEPKSDTDSRKRGSDPIPVPDSGTGTGRDTQQGPDMFRAPLVAVDHIKVYHDVGYTMFVRNVLDAWAFKEAASGKEGGTTATRKVRVLKGKRLVLVDARSKGVLLS
jgi:hypothetical protein